MSLTAVIEVGTFVATLLGATLALGSGLLAERIRDRRSARAAARLLYAELSYNARQIWSIRNFAYLTYAKFHAGLDESDLEELTEAGLDASESGFLDNLEEFVVYLENTDREDVRSDLTNIFRERLRHVGISLEETIRRAAWEAHGASLMRTESGDTLALIQRAYEGVDRARTVAHLGEPVVLTGEFFEEHVSEPVTQAIGRLGRIAGVEPGALSQELAVLREAGQSPTVEELETED